MNHGNHQIYPQTKKPRSQRKYTNTTNEINISCKRFISNKYLPKKYQRTNSSIVNLKENNVQVLFAGGRLQALISRLQLCHLSSESVALQ
jgi:hypothetical protein